MGRPFYADAMGFLAPQGQLPVADPDLKLDLVHLTSAPPMLNTTEEIIAAHREFQKVVAGDQSDRFVTVRDGKRDLREESFARDKRTRVVFGLQKPPQDLLDAENPRAEMERLRHEGIRIMTLAYNGPERYGSGFLDPYGPLTDDGKKLIKLMVDCGMILDLSHVGHQTAWDALGYIDNRLDLSGVMPVMASHGGCYGAMECYNPRNLPDEILKKIAWMNGVVGIYTLTFGLHPSDNGYDPFIAHLRGAIRLCGEDHVVLGTDGVYQMQDIDAWQAHHQWMMENVPNAKQMRAHWPDQMPILNCPERLDMIMSMLVGRGFLRGEIENVMGRNFLEFLRRSL